MNILEAIEAVKNGECVKYVDEYGKACFVMQTTLLPIGKKEIVWTSVTYYINSEFNKPTLDTLQVSTLTRICVDAIFKENFSIITLEEMLKEFIQTWEKYKKDKEE